MLWPVAKWSRMIVQEPAGFLQVGGGSQERQGGSSEPIASPLASFGSFRPNGNNEPGVSHGAHVSLRAAFECNSGDLIPPRERPECPGNRGKPPFSWRV